MLGVGDRIRFWRRQRDMSVRQLAARAGVAHSYVSRLEHDEANNPTLGSLLRIADALGVPLGDLLGLGSTPRSLDFMPERLREFIMEPNNLGFVELGYLLWQAGLEIRKRKPKR